MVATELMGELVVEGGLGARVIAIVGLVHLLVLAAPAGEQAFKHIRCHKRIELGNFALDGCASFRFHRACARFRFQV